MSKTYETDSKIADELNELTKRVDKIGNGFKIVHHDYFEDLLCNFEGKILTIVDASIPEGKQNKCVKDLIKSEYYSACGKNNEFYGYLGSGSVLGEERDHN